MGILDGRIAVVAGSAVIESRGGEAVANDGDVAAFGGAENLIATADDALDVLLNDAGVIRDKRIVSMSADDVDAVVRVHLTGTFR